MSWASSPFTGTPHQQAAYWASVKLVGIRTAKGSTGPLKPPQNVVILETSGNKPVTRHEPAVTQRPGTWRQPLADPSSAVGQDSSPGRRGICSRRYQGPSTFDRHVISSTKVLKQTVALDTTWSPLKDQPREQRTPAVTLRLRPIYRLSESLPFRYYCQFFGPRESRAAVLVPPALPGHLKAVRHALERPLWVRDPGPSRRDTDAVA